MDRRTVFIVEDSAVCVAAIRLVIDRDPGWRVVGAASNGNDAMGLCAGLDIDVLTLDLHMPGGGGFDMLDDIKARCPAPVVIVSTSTYEGSPVIAEALRRGADACFDKRKLLSDPAGFLAVLRAAVTVPDAPVDR